jgi:hypothetical protein
LSSQPQSTARRNPLKTMGEIFFARFAGNFRPLAHTRSRVFNHADASPQTGLEFSRAAAKGGSTDETVINIFC